ncbi:MAG: prolyl oligopeptidase family serine peptidase [Betaproteobacteria bacterium]|nr:prolyl oligopeptidase family serine peptidase [Betaproteobacteria bacterium]
MLGKTKGNAVLAAIGSSVASLGIFIGVIAACVLVAGKAIAAPAFGPKLIQEEARIAAPGGYEVAATILRPAGPGPYGAIILNHGVAGSERERLTESPANDFAVAAPILARRGFVVVMPMRRGFGDTGGEFAEDAGSCRKPDYFRGENAAADDVMAAYNYARRLPYVDGSRMILAGQSAGGVVSMFAAATRHPEGLVAVLGFAAGRGGNPDLRPGVPCAVEAMARMFDAMGRDIQVPVLMHYAENDKYFNPATSKLWYDRLTAAGAKQVQYVVQPAFGRDGHYLFGELLGVRYWLPTVEKFLAANHVRFDPIQAPGELLQASAPTQVTSDSCKGLYRVFLESPSPRAYAVSDDGRCGFAGGLAEARETALRECRNVAGGSCALYAVDSEVVWKPEAELRQAAAKPGVTASTGSR